MSLLIVPKTERMAKISGYTDQRLTDSLVYTQNSMENSTDFHRIGKPVLGHISTHDMFLK